MRKGILYGIVAAIMLCGPSLSFAESAPVAGAPGRMGIETGYFSCSLPVEGWERNDDDGSDPKSYMMTFHGPRAEGAPVTIYIEFFADGNRDFDGYADFVSRNTYDSWENKPIAEAKKITVNGNSALWFEREEKTFLNPESKSDASVMLKEKFYVFLGKDKKGFFVLHYSAPSSVFADHLEAFEKIAGSFQLL